MQKFAWFQYVILQVFLHLWIVNEVTGCTLLIRQNYMQKYLDMYTCKISRKFISLGSKWIVNINICKKTCYLNTCKIICQNACKFSWWICNALDACVFWLIAKKHANDWKYANINGISLKSCKYTCKYLCCK